MPALQSGCGSQINPPAFSSDQDQALSTTRKRFEDDQDQALSSTRERFEDETLHDGSSFLLIEDHLGPRAS